MTGRLIAIVLLLVGVAFAQFQAGSSDIVRRLRVRVALGDHAPCEVSTRVVLTGATGLSLAEASVNGECMAEFFDVPSGQYRVTVRGADVTNADEGDIEVNPVITQEVEVRARCLKESDASRFPLNPFVSVMELGIPSNAAKEFEKANRLLEKQDWTKAAERLHKGLAIYPKYATGYNNLGVAYSRLGNNAQAREALQQAIVLDSRLAPAYVNLGRLSFREKDYGEVESLLSKANSLAPAPNADELFLLAYAQLSNHHLDDAIQTARHGHEGKFGVHGILHVVAANAYEQQHRISDSISELRMYLDEEPSAPQAERVRKALATLQAQVTAR